MFRINVSILNIRLVTCNMTAKWNPPRSPPPPPLPSDHFPWHSLCCCLVVFTEKQTQVFVFVLLYVCLCYVTASCVMLGNEELYAYVPIYLYHPTPVYVVLMYISNPSHLIAHICWLSVRLVKDRLPNCVERMVVYVNFDGLVAL